MADAANIDAANIDAANIDAANANDASATDAAAAAAAAAVATERLPRTLTRSLEADLRALSADARKHNPAVKNAAERVILLLKEADSAAADANAADSAAAVFCAACAPPDPPPSPLPSASAAAQLAVALRAVSSLHRLITYRALAPASLPPILDALHRLCSPCFDDDITLKLLQTLLSLLTVRPYVCALSDPNLSRAFSMLFHLRSVRSTSASNPASSALSAISHFSTHAQAPTPSTPSPTPPADRGVIEHTAHAAFRQVASDLFAAAAEAAVRTAVERHAASGQFIPLAAFPSEATAAFNLFLDLCHAIAAEPCHWLSSLTPNPAHPLHLTLAIEVIDDSLASNIALFAAQPVFSELLLARLCPALHKLLSTTSHKPTLKSLLSLVVTLVRNYWRNLRPDTETFCHMLANLARVPRPNANAATRAMESWRPIYAMEALRCIFSATASDSSPLVDFVRAYDLADGSAAKCVAGVLDTVAHDISLVQDCQISLLPPAPITAAMKPFAKLIANQLEFVVAIAIGLHVQIVNAAADAVRNNLISVAVVLLPPHSTANIISILAALLRDLVGPPSVCHLTATEKNAQMSAFQTMLDSIVNVAVLSDACNIESLREKTITTVCTACAQRARCKPPAEQVVIASKQLHALCKALLHMAGQCKASLGRLWEPIIDTLDQIDALCETMSTSTDRDVKAFASVVKGLDENVMELMTCTSQLPWESCHDLISALVRCSRQSVAQIAKDGRADDSARLGTDFVSPVRLFGVAGAQVAMLSALRREDGAQTSVPSALWQLLTGHLTSICVHTASQPLRAYALASLTKIACGALQGECTIRIEHERIVCPFLDLLSSPYADVHLGTLSAVYSILEKHGENLEGDSAWRIILQILSIATGMSSQQRTDEQSESGSPANFEASPETVSDGFKLVQFIADDFLSSLTKNSFPMWLDLLGLCSSQVHDVNVALTSIGLMWRTADFIAKVGEVGKDDDLWIALFQVLKQVSMDDRPEIRNCAVKTLTGALSAHSSRLSAVAWNGCVEKALLPLLEEVMQGGSSAAAEDAPALSNNRSDVQLLMHHSRDTPRKQWNETRVLALAGVAKLLRTAMPRLSFLKDENGRPLFLMLTDGGTGGLWRKMLRAAGVAAASRDAEVAVAGVSALLELLDAAGLVVQRPSVSAPELSPGLERSFSSSKPSASSFWLPSFVGAADAEDRKSHAEDGEERKRLGTVSLWESVWCALSEATGGRQLMTHDGNHHHPNSSEKKLEVVDERALRILSEGLISSRKRLADKFTPSSSRVLVEVLLVLSLGRRSPEAVKSVGATAGVSQVQDVTLQGLQELSFGKDEASWSALIEGMLGIVSREDISRGSRHALSTRVLQLLSRMYQSDETPAVVKASQTANVLRVLGKIMVSSNTQSRLGRNFRSIEEVNGVNAKKDEDSGDPLWIQATEVVVIAMKQGSTQRGANVNDEVWREFGKLVTDMLFNERKRGHETNYRPEECERREMNDVRLVECVKDGLSRMGSSTSSVTKQDLVRILARGAEEGQMQGRPRFVRGCQKKLFQLADGAQENITHVVIKEECRKCVVETCSRVLDQYNADGHRAGKCPLPAGRRAEAVFLLQQLRKMRRTDGWAQHLTCLYARFCECVDSRDEAVRWLAKELLDESAPVAQGTGFGQEENRTKELHV